MRFSCLSLAAFVALLPTPCHAKPKPAPIAPPDIVARFHAAHSIFVTSGELDPYNNCVPYQAIYQAIAAWPGITMADSPVHADLILRAGIFEDSRDSYIRITLIDPMTQNEWSSHIDFIASLSCAAGVSDALSYYVLPNPNPKPLKIPALFPSQISAGKKLYIEPVTLVPTEQKPNEPPPPIDFDATAMLTQAVTSSGLYTIVDSPSSADLILAPALQPPDVGPSYKKSGVALNFILDSGAVTMNLLDAATRTSLWQQKNNLVNNLSARTNEQRFEQSLPYIIKDWKSYTTKGHL
jgi:hypothetical protein